MFRAARVLCACAAALALLLTGSPARARPAPLPQQSQTATVRQAVDALKSQDYRTALNILGPLAEQGQAEAQCYFAMMHQKGLGVQQNPQEALRWYTLSALQGWRDAMFMAAQMYYNGDGIPEDLKSGADLFLRGAFLGDNDAQWAFGICLCSGQGRAQDKIEGAAWFIVAAEQGHQDAKSELAKLRPSMSQEDFTSAQSVAGNLADMIAKSTWDPNKLPPVPVPAWMSAQAPQTAPTQPQPAPTESAPTQPATEPAEAKTIQLTATAEILANGDVVGQARLEFPAEFYRQMKELVPEPRYFLRDLSTSRSNQELAPDARAAYDDAGCAVVLDIHMLGAASNRGAGRWAWKPDHDAFLGQEETAEGRQRVSFSVKQDAEEEGFSITGSAVYLLPAGASEVSWNETDSQLEYQIPHQPGTGEGRLHARFLARDRIMSCLHKVYGMDADFPAHWVGKAILTNTGDGPITDLKVRFQFGQYSSLDLWQKYPEVLPGQTVVSAYHPVLDKSIAELTSTTPANLLAEWKYVDSKGREQEDSDGGRVMILGRHEFIFSSLTKEENLGTYFDFLDNADFVAAWVSRDDPVVKQFAAAANKAAGGAGAPYSNEAALKALKACYEIMQANNFTYQGPVSVTDANMSFDFKLVQSMKFPRDVIRDRSGTCIELTSLYCSMAHAVGLNPYMVLIPGHAFPAVDLPDGGFVAVETTGVGGGQRFGSTPWDQVVQSAMGNYQKAMEKGEIVIVNIEDAWVRGVSNPELESVPPDILQRWGIVLDFTLSADGGQSPTTSGPVQPTQPNQPVQPEVQPANTNASAFVGRWSGRAQQRYPTGQVAEWPITIEIGQSQQGITAQVYGDTQVMNQWGGWSRIQVSESFRGRLDATGLFLEGINKTVTIDGMPQYATTDNITLQVQNGLLTCNSPLSDGSTLQFQVQKQP
ncbi:MAG: SEL1-like repeat protein [Planctomycetes bacterium]|nr:SEL1-like repeat protein [Planctomycetota bacterium]